jgi:CRP-like cAMP-binding protein
MKPEFHDLQNRGSVGFLVRSACRDEPDADLPRALATQERSVSSGELLAMEGERSRAVICVLAGWLALGKSLSNGTRQIIDLGVPGDVLDPAASDGLSSALEIEALSDGSVALIPDAAWHGMKRDRPALHLAAAKIAAASQARRAQRMLRLGRGSAEMRLAYALLEICVRLSAVGATRDRRFHLPLTQQSLGDFAGLSSVHVCRTLRRMARRGLISVENHMDIRILDIDALAEIADIEPEALSREILPLAA